MKRGIVYGITTAITFYMALLFESRSLLMIGILEVFIIIFALLYYLRLACRLRIEADAESMVNAIQDGYTIRFTVQNKSRLPINKMRIIVIEENVYAHQKQKAMVTLPVTAGIMKKDGQKEIIQVQTKWYPKDAGLYHIKVKRVFVSDWFGLLEFPLFRKNAKDVVEVLILPKKQPIVFNLMKKVRQKYSRRILYISYMKMVTETGNTAVTKTEIKCIIFIGNYPPKQKNGWCAVKKRKEKRNSLSL